MKIRRIGNQNATEITKDNGDIVLVSYETPVAAYVQGEGWVRTSTKHSSTTSKQITLWLDGIKASERPQSFFDALI